MYTRRAGGTLRVLAGKNNLAMPRRRLKVAFFGHKNGVFKVEYLVTLSSCLRFS
jgi:hypothetical protein